MTRFARAKGSKASNERVPEDSTPWSEMKKQMISKKQESEEVERKREADQKRQKNYKAFLEEVEEEKRKNSKWAEFPGSKPRREVKSMDNEGENKHEKKNGKLGKKRKLKQGGEVVEKKQKVDNENLVAVDPKIKKKKEQKNKLIEEQENVNSIRFDKKKEKKMKKLEVVAQSISSENATDEQTVIKQSRYEKKKKFIKVDSQKIGLKEPKLRKVKKSSIVEESVTTECEKREQVDTNESKYEKKKKKKLLKIVPQKSGLKQEKPKKAEKKPLAEEDAKKVEKKKQKKLRQLEKKKLSKLQNLTKKFNDKDKPQRRKKLQERMIINGKEVDIAYVDGFPIKKEDAQRIHQLRKEMISKGLPRSEIKIALKLERRKAEKAFAREKKKVCFNCRKSGHNLSECPDLQEQVETTGTGICFKCGSTEHTHFECKVVKGQEFKFAQCFICHEQGHIARQCPDNARGLYPKGGACKVCGDVTHLKKDCPKYQAQQQQLSGVNVEMMSEDNPDDLGNEKIIKRDVKRPNKIVKF